jgi:hypothetical protein
LEASIDNSQRLRGLWVGPTTHTEKTWQRHLEKKLGLKPVMDNGFGGKE